MANPHAADTPHWEAAFEHYYQDHVEIALEAAAENGIGEGADFLKWYRVIEAEAITRRKSQMVQLSPWLSLEFVAEELMGLEVELAQWALGACEEVATRLGWDHSVSTLLTILAEETDGPWASNPYGYCVSKDSYEKICLPNYLLDDPTEFSQAVAHEYAHVISTNVADEYAPRWVEEAISVLVERKFDPDIWKQFADSRATWLTESDLESVLTDRTDDLNRKDEIWRAYQQAGWIGKYLAHLKSEASLGEFLAEIANEIPKTNILRSLLRQYRTDSALRQVYGISKKELFDRAYDWMCEQSEPSL